QNWRSLSDPEQRAKLRSFLAEDRRKGFDLSQAPLFRLALIELSEGVYQFVWSHHHLLIDGWSAPLLIHEVLAFYNAICQCRPFRLEPSFSYSNYIAWLQRQDISKAEAFWREALEGCTAPTTLAVTTPVTVSEELNQHEQRTTLSAEFTASLRSFAQRNKLML